MLRVAFLLSGAIAPAIYWGLIAGAPALFPGYDHATQFVSELGGPAAPHPEIFNVGILLAGLMTVLGGFGVAMAARSRGGGLLACLLAGGAIAVFGASLVVGGIYPLPDQRHMAWGMGFAVQVAPLLVLWALGKAEGLGGLKAFLIVELIAVNGLLAVMFGVGDLVGQDNIGLWQRAYGLAMFPWIAVTAVALLRTPPARGGFAPAWVG